MLGTAGLSAQARFVLLHTYVNGAIVHLQRANHVPEAWCRRWDKEVGDFLAEMLGVSLDESQRALAFSPLAHGGLGLGS